MEGWALWSAVPIKVVETALHASLPKQGLRLLTSKGSDAHVANLYSHRAGTLLLVEKDLPNPTLARAICDELAKPARYLQLALKDADVTGTVTELPTGKPKDIAKRALEILQGYNNGTKRKFTNEQFHPLVEALLEVPASETPDKIVRFAAVGSPRVAPLVRAVKNGATWERTELGGQTAIRVKGTDGTRISVLTDTEEQEFLAAVK